MDQLRTCGCHQDYHELGVHQPDHELVAAHADAGGELAASGAA